MKPKHFASATMGFDLYQKSWVELAKTDPFYELINSAYSEIEGDGSQFQHYGRFFFGDVVCVRGFPGDGMETLLTKGLSGFQVQSGDNSLGMRIELAWTVLQGQTSSTLVDLMVTVADHMLEGGVGYHQNELIPMEFDFNAQLDAFMISNNYWLQDGANIIDSSPRTFIMELFALSADEVALAEADIDDFSAHMEETGAEVENVLRIATRKG
jgi:hypothetical protein